MKLVLMCPIVVSIMAGCEAVGFFAQGVAGGDPPPIRVTAEYDGLSNQTVAVLVNADLGTLYEHPNCQLEVGLALSRELAANVAGIKIINPNQIVEFQRRNLYWHTLTYPELAKRLNVTRLVLVEIVDYRTHEPGNVNIWQGVIAGQIGVVEADGDKPKDQIYGASVTVRYPEDRPVGILDANEATILKAVLDRFAKKAGEKFHEHEEPRPR